MKQKSISQIIKDVAKMQRRPQKVKYLQENASTTLVDILNMAFNKKLKWLLPEGAPPYKQNKDVDNDTMLYSEIKKVYLFLEGGHPNLAQHKREQLFTQFLEMLHPDDAQLIIDIKDGKFKGMAPETAIEAFPMLANYITIDPKKERKTEDTNG